MLMLNLDIHVFHNFLQSLKNVIQPFFNIALYGKQLTAGLEKFIILFSIEMFIIFLVKKLQTHNYHSRITSTSILYVPSAK